MRIEEGLFHDPFEAIHPAERHICEVNRVLNSRSPVGLVGGAPLTAADWAELRRYCGEFVAADSGADAFLDHNIAPAAVIGDLDSISLEAKERFSDKLHLLPEQETTDFAKSLRSISAPWVLATGVSGGRFDHTMAAMHTLTLYPDRRCVVLGQDSLVLLCPSEINLRLPMGSDLGLFPLGPCQVASSGLEWPTDGLDFHPTGPIGTSNRIADQTVSLRATAPVMLLILPRAALPEVARALPAATQWPERAM